MSPNEEWSAPQDEANIMGNSYANIVASLIIAGAIVGSNSLNQPKNSTPESIATNEAAYQAWLARAVGDIRNDIVVNCGCCGEEADTGTAKRTPTRSF